jgi:hypothetical protein
MHIINLLKRFSFTKERIIKEEKQRRKKEKREKGREGSESNANGEKQFIAFSFASFININIIISSLIINKLNLAVAMTTSKLDLSKKGRKRRDRGRRWPMAFASPRLALLHLHYNEHEMSLE